MDPRVLERVMHVMRDDFGNAASRNHAFGWKAEELCEKARKEVAARIGATAREIIFTSGATESNNLAIFGLAAAFPEKKHIISQRTEHKAVLDPLADLARKGYDITLLNVNEEGLVTPNAVLQALRSDTLLVSLMWVNNEVGTVQPVHEVGSICHRQGVFLHTDATQALGHFEIDVNHTVGPIDLLSASAHKIYGPKGVGALFVRRRGPRVPLLPMVFGGGQERGRRSGTLNVPGIVGLGMACTLAGDTTTRQTEHVQALQRRLWQGLQEKCDPAPMMNGPALGPQRHPGNLNISFEGADAEAVIMGMRRVAISSGAACASTTMEPSHVLRAMGLSAERAHGSLRFGLGRGNTEEEVDDVVDLLAMTLSTLQGLQG